MAEPMIKIELYDVDKVVAQLKDLDKQYHENNFKEYEQILHFAIEIVKRGGVNEID